MSDTGYSTSEENNEVNRILNQYEEAVRNEKYLLLSTHFVIEPMYMLRCGLSPLRFFKPVVQIVNQLDQSNVIFMDRFEWYDFILLLNRIVQHNPDVPLIPVQFGSNLKLSVLPIPNIKMVVLSKKDVCHYFTENEVLQLLAVDNKINIKINYLLKFNMLACYYRFLDDVNELLLKYNYIFNPVDIMKSLCNLSNEIETYTIFELLSLDEEFVLADLYGRRVQ